MEGRFRIGASAAASTRNDVPNNGGTANPSRVGGAVSVHPTTAYLMALVIGEYLVYVFLRRYFRHAHGG